MTANNASSDFAFSGFASAWFVRRNALVYLHLAARQEAGVFVGNVRMPSAMMASTRIFRSAALSMTDDANSSSRRRNVGVVDRYWSKKRDVAICSKREEFGIVLGIVGSKTFLRSDFRRSPVAC